MPRRFFNARVWSALGLPQPALEYLRAVDEDATAVQTQLDTHEAATDPHPQYLTPVEGNAAYAPISKGVTNGDSHDHSGGDGAQIAYSSLGGLPDLSSLHARSHAVTSTSDHTAGNWKILYTNGSGEVVELALSSSGFLQSNGASSAPSWSTPETAIADAVGGDEVTKINAILAALRAKNIIST